MSDLLRVLEAFSKATHCEAAVWVRTDGTGPPRAEARTARAPDLPTLPRGPSPEKFVVRGDELRVAAVPGPRAAWLAVGPCKSPGGVLDQLFDFLLPVVTQYIQSALEVEHAATELAERYEEINLLYTIGEILGRTVTLDETARTILGEISETVGARRGAILVLDRADGDAAAGRRSRRRRRHRGVDSAWRRVECERGSLSIAASGARRRRRAGLAGRTAVPARRDALGADHVDHAARAGCRSAS